MATAPAMTNREALLVEPARRTRVTGVRRRNRASARAGRRRDNRRGRRSDCHVTGVRLRRLGNDVVGGVKRVRNHGVRARVTRVRGDENLSLAALGLDATLSTFKTAGNTGARVGREVNQGVVADRLTQRVDRVGNSQDGVTALEVVRAQGQGQTGQGRRANNRHVLRQDDVGAGALNNRGDRSRTGVPFVQFSVASAVPAACSSGLFAR